MTAPVLACAAEAWGFGPASKLLAIARRTAARCVAITSGSAAVFADLNRSSFDRLVALDKPSDILQYPLEADHLLNVMDPCAALLARRCGVPTTYVDSLHWFWRWSPDDYDDFVREAEAMLWMTPEDLDQHLGHVDWHRMVPLAYLWSDEVFLQRFGSPDPRMRVFGERVRYCGAIIDFELSATPSSRSGGVVSLSGGLSHVATVAAGKTYAAAIRELLRDSVLDSLAGPDIFGHPAVAAAAGDHGALKRSLDRNAMNSALRSAGFIVAPAGLTTALEAAAAGLPLGFLPEQHGGHLANVRLLSGGDGTLYPAVLVSERLGLRDLDPTDFIEQLTAGYELMLREGGSLMSTLRDEMRRMVDQLTDPDWALPLAARQRQRVEEMVGGLDGAQVVADAVSARLTSVNPRRKPGDGIAPDRIGEVG